MTFKNLSSPQQEPALNWTAVVFFTSIHALALLAPWCFSWAAFFDYQQYQRFAPNLARDPFYWWLNHNFLLLNFHWGSCSMP